MVDVLVWVTLGLAIASLGVSSLALALALRRQSMPAIDVSQTPALPEPKPSPLDGLNVAVAITQDHAHPVFVNMLSGILEKLDARALTMQAQELDPWTTQAEILISGVITCNGYSEVYYRAELTCSTASETICTVIENPASGDRQANLAQELITRLEAEIAKRLSRAERRIALRELSGLDSGSE